MIMTMDEDKLSVITVKDLSSNENQIEGSKNKEEILGAEEPSEDKISVISVEDLPSNENQKEGSKTKEEILGNEEPSAWNICHVFSVLIVCVIFLSPPLLIPRTNSIFYQSNWYEFNFVMTGLMILPAVNDLLSVATYCKEKSCLSFRMFLKTWFLFMVTCPCHYEKFYYLIFGHY